MIKTKKEYANKLQALMERLDDDNAYIWKDYVKDVIKLTKKYLQYKDRLK